MDKTTPRPWRATVIPGSLHWSIHDSDGKLVAARLTEGRACLIVTAVNAHDELVGALRDALEALRDIVIMAEEERPARTLEEAQRDFLKILDLAEAALAKAGRK